MATAAPTDAYETREGLLERIVYRGDDGAFAIALVRADGALEPFKAVGELAGLEEGERIRLLGHARVDPRFGPQFKVAAAYPLLPHTAEALRTWLASRQIRSVGPKLAERLVAWFGKKTLHVILNDPERLEEVEGIGPKRRTEIAEQVRERAVHRDAQIFLQSLGLTPALANRVFKRYEGNTIPRVRENPYRMAEEVSGVGFATADRVAQSLGFTLDHPARQAAALVHLLARAAEEGHVFLPREALIERATRLLGEGLDVNAEIDQLVAEGRLIEEEGIYLDAMYQLESELAERLRGLLAVPVEPLMADPAEFERRTGLELAPEQRHAVELAARTGVMVLTGGPGTGKTTIVQALLHLLHGARLRVALAAPTGRAARRLSETTSEEAATLHRLLEYHPGEGFRRNEDEPLDVQALIVDEASMLDQALAVALLRALPPGTRLILVGDADQLPSVGAGNVLADLLDSGVVPAERLTRIFRQAEQSCIVQNAHRVLAGQSPRPPEDPDDSDFYLVRAGDPAQAAELIARMVEDRIPQRFGLDPIDDIQVLAPMHRGVCGAQQLNALLQARLNPDGERIERGGRQFRVGDKVMQIRNDYDKEVFNGDLGRVIGFNDKGLVVRFEQRLLTYEPDQFDDIVLAYACSVHKSQGSEYPAVVVPMLTEHWVMLQRNLLYTAITRGRRLVVVVGQPKAIAQAARRADGQRRYTALARRLGANP